MPLYEYYCDPCNGIFESIRPMREASLPVPCPECNRDAARIMSSFNAFTFRDGYPRRLPDKGTFWHMGKEVKQRAKRMRWDDHPETTEPKPHRRPGKGGGAGAGDHRGGGGKVLRRVKAKKAKAAKEVVP